jgi:hypothetical protein
MYVKNADMIGRRVRLRSRPELGVFEVWKIVAVQGERLLCGFIITGGSPWRHYEVVRREITIAR